jgi:apolipoprotein N-acyltransferase
LRFSWLSVGYAFSFSHALPFMAGFGLYGIGFLFMAWAAFVGTFAKLSNLARLAFGVLLAALSTVPLWLPAPASPGVKSMILTGIQLEASQPAQVKSALDSALKKFPQTDLFVLNEYAFMEPIPTQILNWCKQHGKWLVAGGEDPVSPTDYYNTAFVISPDGAIVFRQAKCVPVQFMRDGLPAREQKLWDSPWGKLGFGICYDASYTWATDELVRQGAQALIFPTMDPAEWGKYQHELHGRVAPMRAAEYALPIFRVCSSGISQFVGPTGRVIATAPFPGQSAMLNARMELLPRGRMPLDRPLAQLSAVVTGALILFLIFDALLKFRKPK